jgi:ribose 5-phosphate isomerase B
LKSLSLTVSPSWFLSVKAGAFLPISGGVIGPAAYMVGRMRIAVSTDLLEGAAEAVIEQLESRGHEVLRFGAYDPEARADWAWGSEAAARAVAGGEADQGVVCCWTGTGASIAANKVPGVRAALCGDPETAEGARRWNDANVLALSLRVTSEPMLAEILDAWFAAAASSDASDAANIAHVDEIT